MIYVFFAAILFGFVHPGSKVILDTGIDLLSFCTLYVGIRLVAQTPYILKNRLFNLPDRSSLFTLLGIGIVGALLQIAEFKGISDGMPVSIVTFLVYSHPIWTILVSRLINKEKITTESVSKVLVGILGLAFITGANSDLFSLNPWLLVGPLVAGLLIASWVSLAAKAKQKNISSWSISFYYDLFAFIVLATLLIAQSGLSNSAETIGNWIIDPAHFGMMVFYSIVIGLLPNLLFYQGTQKVSAFAASMVLLLEPTISSATAHVAWNEAISETFLVGALLVLLSAAPMNLLAPKLRVTWYSLRRVAFAVLLMVALATAAYADPKTKKLHVLEIVPSTQDNYTVSAEFRQIESAVKLALVDYAKQKNSCPVEVTQLLKRSSEEDLYKEVQKLSESVDPKSNIMVGISRSAFARVAAKAAEKTSLRAISIGAATANLGEINKNFVSVASPWVYQWQAIKREMRKDGCTGQNVVGFFDPKDHLSKNFKDAFEKESEGGRSYIYSDFLDGKIAVQPEDKCYFFAVNFSVAQSGLKMLNPSLGASIYGIGDWNYFTNELREHLKANTGKKLIVKVPTGWISGVSKNSEQFAKRFAALSGSPATPLAAYAYDAALIGSTVLCRGVEFAEIPKQKDLPLLRKYSALAQSGNFESLMNIVILESEKMK